MADVVQFELECRCVLLELESTVQHYFPFSVNLSIMGILYTIFCIFGVGPFSRFLHTSGELL